MNLTDPQLQRPACRCLMNNHEGRCKTFSFPCHWGPDHSYFQAALQKTSSHPTTYPSYLLTTQNQSVQSTLNIMPLLSEANTMIATPVGGSEYYTPPSAALLLDHFFQENPTKAWSKKLGTDNRVVQSTTAETMSFRHKSLAFKACIGKTRSRQASGTHIECPTCW
jgi:hypothetical protein